MLVYNKANGSVYKCQRHPFKDEWLIPEDCTIEEPPQFDAEKEFVVYADNKWTVNQIPVPEDEPEIDEFPEMDSSAMGQLRGERDSLLNKCDFRILPDYVGGDQEAWKAYRQKLRDMSAQIEAGTLPQPTLDDYGILNPYPKWPTPPA